MPTYVYKFIDTGETIEVQQAFTDDALTEATHPTSGAVMQVKKVFLPVGVTFKGGGFYKTDSRGGSSTSAAGSSSSSAASPSSGSGSSTGESGGSSSSGSSSGDSSGSSSGSPAPAKAPAAASSSGGD
ncbi:MAG: FmdB family transcriptional regulator [Actinomycetota bacterium]|nr:FmdB family transcriptional regulator [Actinomycetota bacterium]